MGVNVSDCPVNLCYTYRLYIRICRFVDNNILVISQITETYFILSILSFVA